MLYLLARTDPTGRTAGRQLPVVIVTPEEGRTLWRVGYYADPLGFTPLELYQFSHRFDDIYRRFHTLYCADLAERSLREVLADFRPNLGALRRHVERYGPEAAQNFTEKPITAQWREQVVKTTSFSSFG
jgi:hypothetical protein